MSLLEQDGMMFRGWYTSNREGASSGAASNVGNSGLIILTLLKYSTFPIILSGAWQPH